MYQSWALALFSGFAHRSIALFSWIAIAHTLLFQISRLAHCSIALKKQWFALVKFAKMLNCS